ncbi:MAG: protein kinase [Planctomycetota bacterium]
MDANAKTRLSEQTPDPFVGRTFGGYRIDGVVGRGGMGTVYKARQLSLGRPVAIKMLPLDLAREEQFLERFHREADALSRLSHPSVVAVFDRGEVDGQPYLVMEYVEGTSLRDAMRNGPLPLAEALRVTAAVLEALDHAHEKGIVHRDIKPENVLLSKDGVVKVADFGLSRLLGPDDGTRLTRTQLVLGTYEYMAPEQREHAREADPRSDLYATGVVLYELLAGELPIGHFAALSRKRPKECDSRIDEIVEKSLAKSPDERYQRASEMGAAVSRILSAAALPPEAPRAEVHVAARWTAEEEGCDAPRGRWKSRMNPAHLRDPAQGLGCLVFLVGLVFGLGLLRSVLLAFVVLIVVRAVPSVRRAAKWIAVGLCVVALVSAVLLMGTSRSSDRPPSPRWLGDAGLPVSVETRDGWLFGNVTIGIAKGTLPDLVGRELLTAERVKWLEKVAPVPFKVDPETVKLTVSDGRVVVTVEAETHGARATENQLIRLGTALAVILERGYPEYFLRDSQQWQTYEDGAAAGAGKLLPGSDGTEWWTRAVAVYDPLTTAEAREATDPILKDPNLRAYVMRWCNAPTSFPEGVSLKPSDGHVFAYLDTKIYEDQTTAAPVLDGIGRWIAHVAGRPFRPLARLPFLPDPAMVEGLGER